MSHSQTKNIQHAFLFYNANDEKRNSRENLDLYKPCMIMLEKRFVANMRKKGKGGETWG